jgi:hypothetical protein
MARSRVLRQPAESGIPDMAVDAHTYVLTSGAIFDFLETYNPSTEPVGNM